MALVFILDSHNQHFFSVTFHSQTFVEVLTALIGVPGLALYLVLFSTVTICAYCTLAKLRACLMLAIRLPYLRLCIKANLSSILISVLVLFFFEVALGEADLRF